MYKLHRQLRVPFVFYEDLNANLEVVGKINRNNSGKPYTDKNQGHSTCSYGYKLVCVDIKFSGPVQIYQGENAINKLINKMF